MHGHSASIPHSSAHPIASNVEDRQALAFYGDRRGSHMLGRLTGDGWHVATTPHLAFWNSPPEQRLYLSPNLSVSQYVTLFEGEGLAMVGQYSPDELSTVVWPWLVDNRLAGRATAADRDGFARRLGQRPLHIRPGMEVTRRWTISDAVQLEQRRRLHRALRSAIELVFGVLEEPPLPTASWRDTRRSARA
jgi:hypothetical protein